MRLIHLIPFLLQSLIGPLGAKAKASSALVSMYIWVPSTTDAIEVNGPEWTGKFAVAAYYETENKQYHPDQDFRMIGRVQLDTALSQEFLIYFDPFQPTYTRVEVSHLSCHHQ